MHTHIYTYIFFSFKIEMVKRQPDILNDSTVVQDRKMAYISIHNVYTYYTY